MTTQPRLVNKQFNSPIGLYSEQNVRDVIEREQQILANGAIGIDFHNPQVGKPTNLQNSAVLRMLEEEENRRGGRTGNHDDYYPRPLRDVSWPPSEYEQKNQVRSHFKDVVIPGVKRVAWPPPQEGILDPSEAEQTQQVPAQIQGGPQYSNKSPGFQQNNYSPQQASVPYQQPPQPLSSYRPLKPLDVSSVGTGSPLTSPAINQSPQGYRPATPVGSRGWAPVHSPASTPIAQSAQKYFGAPANQSVSQSYHKEISKTQSYQGAYQQTVQQHQTIGHQHQQPSLLTQQSHQSYQSQQSYQSPQQTNRSTPSYQQSSPQPQYNQPQSIIQQASPSQNQSPYQSVGAQNQAPISRPQQQSAKHVEPPPSTITLRPAAPVSQTPAPVYSAQPATASLRGGKHLRGDLKWPPENVKQRMDEEKRHLEELAKGPACRPTKKEKDYTPFFAQHALNSTYPGYKIPPGTQYFRPE
ncbi:DNA translocase FtsK isoform X2 [Anthonomus grandis grandis]|uniref:DNA translocase FtsK isoform X2 n=1 Tax=Anthonomus grandis grandis TaxID=2921223 RepID=UPI00216540C7|nr:DNA translocase FtsK isoform X2 [Anthonomus grandis grandis]